ncbi:uncharacterized protein LOC132919054 [Rhopalosiphum padi]|uniref:uncharacterized protein LOC132919054 n=1 Tax=Rhopalosiphum padi TaxID=40932 RepID=UPI00298E744A|nr:uncharacterized protein LOC132919054 [Rhopalosiphum padi]
MSEEKIFIEKFGNKYFCLRQRNNIHCQTKTKSNKKNILKPNQSEIEENEIYKTVDKLENMVFYKLSKIKKFKPPTDKKAHFEQKLHEFLRINELAVGILDEIQYSTDVINDLKMVQIIFNHNLTQLQCIQDEQKNMLENMKKEKWSYKDKILKFILCPCCL